MKALLGCLALILAAGPALADAAPEPEEVPRRFRPLIEAAGYRCPGKVSLKSQTPADYAYARERGVRAWRVRCGDGRSYLLSRITWGQRDNPPPSWVVPVR